MPGTAPRRVAALEIGTLLQRDPGIDAGDSYLAAFAAIGVTKLQRDPGIDAGDRGITFGAMAAPVQLQRDPGIDAGDRPLTGKGTASAVTLQRDPGIDAGDRQFPPSPAQRMTARFNATPASMPGTASGGTHSAAA